MKKDSSKDSECTSVSDLPSEFSKMVRSNHYPFRHNVLQKLLKTTILFIGAFCIFGIALKPLSPLNCVPHSLLYPLLASQGLFILVQQHLQQKVKSSRINEKLTFTYYLYKIAQYRVPVLNTPESARPSEDWKPG